MVTTNLNYLSDVLIAVTQFSGDYLIAASLVVEKSLIHIYIYIQSTKTQLKIKKQNSLMRMFTI